MVDVRDDRDVSQVVAVREGWCAGRHATHSNGGTLRGMPRDKPEPMTPDQKNGSSRSSLSWRDRAARRSFRRSRRPGGSATCPRTSSTTRRRTTRVCWRPRSGRFAIAWTGRSSSSRRRPRAGGRDRVDGRRRGRERRPDDRRDLQRRRRLARLPARRRPSWGKPRGHRRGRRAAGLLAGARHRGIAPRRSSVRVRLASALLRSRPP